MNPANFVGQLVVHIHKCIQLPDSQTLGKQDPYVKIRLDTEKNVQKGKVQNNAGVNPVFEESFKFDLQGFERSVIIEIWDEEVMSDNKISGCELGIEDLVKRTAEKAIWFSMTSKKKDRGGEIFLKASFTGQTPSGRWPPEASPQPVSQPQQPMPPQAQAPYYPPQQPQYAPPQGQFPPQQFYPPQGQFPPQQQPQYPPQGQYPAQQPQYPPQGQFPQVYPQMPQADNKQGYPAYGQQPPIYGQQPPPIYGQQPMMPQMPGPVPVVAPVPAPVPVPAPAPAPAPVAPAPAVQVMEQPFETKAQANYAFDRENWSVPKEGNLWIMFRAESTSDIHVAIQPKRIERHQRDNLGNMYEIVIGGWGNTQSVIRKSPQGENLVTSKTDNVCNPKGEDYWVSIVNGLVSMGTGSRLGERTFISYQDLHPIQCKYFYFAALGNFLRVSNLSYGNF